MSDSEYTIQDLTELSGVPRRTIHFYTQQGILPPPAGAGLGARYGEEQLIRLKLIPILRRQGLRLDDIRRRFSELSLAEMQRLLSALPPPAPQPQASAPTPGLGLAPPSTQAFVHYQLPAGITLMAPAKLGPQDHQNLLALLNAAAQIFGPVTPLRTHKGE